MACLRLVPIRIKAGKRQVMYYDFLDNRSDTTIF